MIIISSRKFRDSQNEFFKLALEDEVILKTLHYGNFRLVPIKNESQKRGRKPKTAVEKPGVVYIPNTRISDESPEISVVEAATPVETVSENTIIETVKPNISPDQINKVPEEENAIETIVNSPLSNHSVIEPESEPTIQNEAFITHRTSDYFVHETDINDNIIEENKEQQPQPVVEVESKVHVSETWKPGNVFVDPSLLSLEEVQLQEGIDDGKKKKGFFRRLLGKN